MTQRQAFDRALWQIVALIVLAPALQWLFA